MKIYRINKRILYVFLIFFSLVGIISYNITEDWASAFFQGLTAAIFFVLIYIVGYSNGVEEGKTKGYDKALEDLNSVLPPELQKNMSEKTK
ncbi:MAG: hypothetical protein HND52_14015 [Ignavibacteriae bacterium]|nr:hypothetical protein [Ignavibacteriota bacterium]NOG99070.1 hypothetical protein [Ignavibacteriota bacterium]